MTNENPVIISTRRVADVAGSYWINVAIQYPDEPVSHVRFKSDTTGGPIVMVTDGCPGGVFVSRSVTDRIGRKLTTDWVAKFFA